MREVHCFKSKQNSLFIINEAVYIEVPTEKRCPILFLSTTHTSATSDNRTKGFGMFALMQPHSLKPLRFLSFSTDTPGTDCLAIYKVAIYLLMCSELFFKGPMCRIQKQVSIIACL